MIVVVMGVSGCGKSSVGQAIAKASGWEFIEGDDLHPIANRTKMASGTPLDDDDRWPWLDAIVDTARSIEADDNSAIIACSALKRIYRDRLSRAGDIVKFIHLNGNRDTILERMQARPDHFMPPALLDSQLATLEPPASDEAAFRIDITSPVDQIAQLAMRVLNEADPS